MTTVQYNLLYILCLLFGFVLAFWFYIKEEIKRSDNN